VLHAVVKAALTGTLGPGPTFPACSRAHAGADWLFIEKQPPHVRKNARGGGSDDDGEGSDGNGGDSERGGGGDGGNGEDPPHHQGEQGPQGTGGGRQPSQQKQRAK
jgi:hypothetical protein